MSEFQSFKNHFLVAMPSLQDLNFQQSVTYICDHNEDGAIGIVINKPVPITLGDILHNLEIPVTDSRVEQYPVLFGGPVAQEQGFVILPARLGVSDENSLLSNDKIVITSSKQALKTIARGLGSTEVVFTLGYAAWTAGQLENEIIENSWLVAPVNDDILFHIPFAQRWRAAAASIGIDFAYLSSDTGHA
jgi:putative transcriptional regulator